MYVLESRLVLAYLIAITLAFCWLLFRCIWLAKREGNKLSRVVLAVVVGILALQAHLTLWQYTDPNEQTVELELVETLQIPAEKTLAGPLPWHGVYESWGIYPESLYYINSGEESHHGVIWPDMDLEHYSYIVSYGQEVESLSYNAWEVIKYPHRSGAKVGHAVLSDGFDPNAIYIYRIEKIRIDNND